MSCEELVPRIFIKINAFKTSKRREEKSKFYLASSTTERESLNRSSLNELQHQLNLTNVALGKRFELYIYNKKISNNMTCLGGSSITNICLFNLFDEVDAAQ